MGTLSSSDTKTFGDLVVGLYNEDILPDYTIRTMKVIILPKFCRHGKKVHCLLCLSAVDIYYWYTKREKIPCDCLKWETKADPRPPRPPYTKTFMAAAGSDTNRFTFKLPMYFLY